MVAVKQTGKELRQMSESMQLGFCLMLAGGFFDAYSYLCRGGVFANAQTGNIVLLGISLAQRDWFLALQYLLPIIVFAVGVYVAERLKWRWQERRDLHWRQIILLIEIAVIFGTAFLGAHWNWLANSMISFVCALQVESFRKIRGNACATTMCTGNLRSAAEAMHSYQKTGNPLLLRKSLLYYLLVIVFVIGALFGGIFTSWLQYKAVLVGLIPLLVCFMLMFCEEDTWRIFSSKEKNRSRS